MLNEQELEQAAAQVQKFRTQAEEHQRTHADVLKQYIALIKDYKRLKSDYEEERDAREKYKQMARGQERNPFVLVLVDGDGYVFDDDLLSNRTDGGQRAARLLNDTVKKSLRGRGLEECRVMVRIYANLAGLSKSLSKVKLCGPEKRALATFTADFTRSNDLFDFVDAGELKEGADFKIRAMFRQFADNPQCRQIFFAACHDVGYLSELTPYIGSRDRITLVKNSAFHPEFTKLGLRTEDFPNIFRTTPLEQSTPVHVAPPTGPALNPTSSTESAPICMFFQKGTCKYGAGCRNQHIKYNNHSDRIATISESKDWRSGPQIAKGNTTFPTPSSSRYDLNGDHGNGIPAPATDYASLLPSLEQIPKDCIAVNKHQQRVDPYIPDVTSEERHSFLRRHSVRRLCNNYHLGQHCRSGEQCQYDHSAASPSELRCLRQLATKRPCSMKGLCRSLTCGQGHLCQRSDCWQRGGKSPCKFPPYAHTISLTGINYIAGTKLATEPSSDDNDENGSMYEDRPSSPIAVDSRNVSFRANTCSSDSEPDATSPMAGASLIH